MELYAGSWTGASNHIDILTAMRPGGLRICMWYSISIDIVMKFGKKNCVDESENINVSQEHREISFIYIQYFVQHIWRLLYSTKYECE